MIAGEARLTLDVRHHSDETRTRSVDDLIRSAQEIAARRGLSVSEITLLSQRAVAMDPFLLEEIEHAMVSDRMQAAPDGERRRSRRHDPGGERFPPQ